MGDKTIAESIAEAVVAAIPEVQGPVFKLPDLHLTLFWGLFDFHIVDPANAGMGDGFCPDCDGEAEEE